ncbi:MAG: sigma-70 family RNA polymerase sigma factor [Planctomycetaceae bacterium]|nr:sigma-70 family RNA polymerase sigma factor [Planctomycetaceae bacterium]
MSDVTRILSAIEQGDPQASEQLLPLVYEELRRLAAQRMAVEKPGQTLQATALVHEAYLRLVDANGVRHWNSRNHFFAAAAEAMRRILVESARRKTALKRGGDADRVDLESACADFAAVDRPGEVIAVHDALDALSTTDALAADLVKLHYFGGFSLEGAAEMLGMSRATAHRLWIYARTWLRAALQDDADDLGSL